MSSIFEFCKGRTPLLVSIPHDGRYLPPEIAERMTEAGRAIPDTDWHVMRLYEFARELGASIISAKVSRYVVDLNRSAADEPLYPGQLSTGLCPAVSFAGEDLYLDGSRPGDQEKRERIETYWRPYHDRLARGLDAIKQRFGYALLWDAHSIPGTVPLLFEGRLPDLNVGTHAGLSCAADLEAAVGNVADSSAYSNVLNGRFKGGYITRHYGNPEKNVHAIQHELVQSCYMDEKSLRYDDADAAQLGRTIRAMLVAFMAAAGKMHAH
jgi:N-formylglutamate amidohydrolase